MDKEMILSLIEEAKNLVADVQEPWRSLAFSAILSKLISESFPSPMTANSSERKSLAKKSSDQHEEQDIPQIRIPDQHLERILALKERDQIPILWHLRAKPSMTVDEFLRASSNAGIAISPSYSPSKGGNFRNRLVKEDKMFVEDGLKGKVPRYKLSSIGKIKIQKFFTNS
jgi:hypothetical protein